MGFCCEPLIIIIEIAVQQPLRRPSQFENTAKPDAFKTSIKKNENNREAGPPVGMGEVIESVSKLKGGEVSGEVMKK